MRPMSNTKTSSRHSKRLPWNGRLNRILLWQRHSEWRGAVEEDDFCHELERLNVQAGQRDKILAAHLQRICEAHDTVIQSYYQQLHGCLGPTRRQRQTSMEFPGEQVHL